MNWKNCLDHPNGSSYPADSVFNCTVRNTTARTEFDAEHLKAAVLISNNTLGSDTKWLTDSIFNRNNFVCRKEIFGKNLKMMYG